MNSETKVLSIIGVVTIIIIVSGLMLASNGTTGSNSNNDLPSVTIKNDALVRPDSPRLTGKNAGENVKNNKKIQIVEFVDLECPACALLHPELKKLIDSDKDNIELVIRFIPIHGNSKASAAAALAAREQGKFFEMYDIIFDHQDDWSGYGKDVNKIFDGYAKTIGLDIEKYHSDLAKNTAQYYALVDRDNADASAMNIVSTPTIIINGTQIMRGAFSYDKLKTAVEEVLSQSQTEKATTTPKTQS